MPDRLFGDTSFYVALLMPRDDLRPAARALDALVAQRGTVTTDAVLGEVLAYASERGPWTRVRAADLVTGLLADRRTTVVRQTPKLFDAGLDLYRARPDKGYSLTDCMSMVICRQRRIKQVLTHDRHFEQGGFTILL